MPSIFQIVLMILVVFGFVAVILVILKKTGKDTGQDEKLKQVHEEMEKIKDGRQCRFATTDELLDIAEKISGKKLDWFFEVYLRHASLPILNVKNTGNKVELSWETENNLPFPMPVDVSIAGKIIRIEMIDGKSVIDLPEGSDFTVGPKDWVLKVVKQ